MKKNLFKFALDIVMGIVFALLFNHRVITGLSFHETAGLAIGGAVIVHILLNAKWVKRVTLGLFSPKVNARTRFEYALDILLVIGLVVILVTGVLVSKVLFPTIAQAVGNRSLLAVHEAVSYLMLGLLGIHAGLHRTWIVATLRNIFHIKGKSNVRRAVANALMAAVLVFGCYNIVSTQYFVKATSFTQSGAGHGHGNKDARENAEQAASGKGGDSAKADSKGEGASSEADGKKSDASSEAQTQGQAQSQAQGDGQAANAAGESGGDKASPEKNAQDKAQGADKNKGGNHGAGTVNPVQVAATYLSILGAFAVATGYIEMAREALKKRKRRSK